MSQTELGFYKKVVNELVIGAYCLRDLEPQVFIFLDAISNLYNKGKGLGDGVTIQWSWVTLKLMQQNQFLVVTQPDFHRNPFIDFTVDISWTLFTSAQQVNLLKSLEIKGNGVLYNQTIVINKGVFNSSKVYLHRTKPISKEDTGWYIDSFDKIGKTQELVSIYTFELIKLRPALIQTLVLPLDYLVIFDENEIISISNNKNNEIWKK